MCYPFRLQIARLANQIQSNREVTGLNHGLNHAELALMTRSLTKRHISIDSTQADTVLQRAMFKICTL